MILSSIFSVFEFRMNFSDVHYESSSDDYDQSGDWDDEDDNDDYYDDGDMIVYCGYCNKQLLNRNYDRHVDNVHHKCDHCTNYMPKKAIQQHIQRKHTQKCPHCTAELVVNLLPQHEATHFTKCEDCKVSFLKENLSKHMAESHPFRTTIGMIRLDKISNEEFNKMINEKRIHAKDGFLFIQ